MRDPMGALDIVLGTLERSPEAPSEERYYANHPLSLGEWFAGMIVAQQYLIERNHCWRGDESFLDAGCALGTKIALASALGWGHVEGIERHSPYADECRHRWPDFRVTIIDAFEFDRYHEFDLVYSFRLCVDLDLQRQLTEYIVNKMKPGALLFLAGGPDPELDLVGPGVWRV